VRDEAQAREAVVRAQEQPVIAVLHVPRAAGVFRRLEEMGIPAHELATVVRAAFSTRLVKALEAEGPVLLYERLLVTDSVRALVVKNADSERIHRTAMAEGMRSLRQMGLEMAKAGRVKAGAVEFTTPLD
jgi:type II secretory ATPase GspE/PulE/Tfp pilus assembly ATPase PilB-like protein